MYVHELGVMLYLVTKEFRGGLEKFVVDQRYCELGGQR